MGINFVAVLLCAVASMVLGMLWHSKALFGPRYMQASGMDMNMPPEKMKEIQSRMWQYYITQFLLAVLTAFVLAYVLTKFEGITAFVTALWIWIGFVIPTVGGACLWSARPRKDAWTVFFISAGYQFVLFAIYGAILGAM